jgi:hypothetical protein
MDNPETQATLSTQDEKGRKHNTTQKTKKMSNMNHVFLIRLMLSAHCGNNCMVVHLCTCIQLI